MVAPDLGAFSERLTGRAWSWVTPWQKTPAQWVSFFEDIRARHFATGQGPSAPVPNMESSAQHELLANASVGDSARWYAAEYLQGLAAPSGPGPELQTLLRQASCTSPVSEGSKGLLLSVLVRLRSLPVLSGVARAIPLRWQTRVKSWLKK